MHMSVSVSRHLETCNVYVSFDVCQWPKSAEGENTTMQQSLKTGDGGMHRWEVT